MIKNNSKDINSNDLNVAMLKAKLSGNEIKVILAYISKGGWKHGTEVFLPESVKLEYGLSDSTVKRIRKGLVEKGWMVPTGNKSQWGCDKYLITIPAPVEGGSNCTTPQTNLNPGVVHSDTRGRSERSTEVTKEVTKEVINNNKVDARAVGASQSSGKPSDSTLPENRIKDKENTEELPALRAAHDSLIDPILLNSPNSSGVLPIGPNSDVVVNGTMKETRGVQNDLPLDEACTKCGAADYEAFCWECGYDG